jgi:hypothetical protein
VRICIATSVPAWAEPRAPRHAVAAKQALPEAEVRFIDLVPRDLSTPDPPNLRAAVGVIRQTIEFPTRATGLLAFAGRKLVVKAARILFRLTGRVTEPVFGDHVIGFTRYLKRVQGDIYIAHNIETLLPAARAATRNGAKLVFDCMEYYSDMGETQASEEAQAARVLETAWLPRCSLVTASSDVLADVLAAEYRIPRPLALYNTPKLEDAPTSEPTEGLKLYWRNSVIGFGQRGLDDALTALTLLPPDVTLSLQGRPPNDGGQRLAARIHELGLAGRVSILPPYPPGEAVREAARHKVGLCLERRGPRNHEYTVSSKLLDYMMAGLAVVVADLPGLRAVVQCSRGGLLFEPGSPDHLAEQIARLHAEPELLAELAANARSFARTEGNTDVDMARFRAALLHLAPVPNP